MGVYIPIKFNGIESVSNLPSKTYALDFETKRVRGYTDKVKAIEQAIKKALLTRRFAYCIYNSDYGNDMRTILFADGLMPDIFESELKRLVADALCADKRILGIDSFEYKMDGDSIFVNMKVNTVFGNSNMQIEI